jgi:hypothetical protein
VRPGATPAIAPRSAASAPRSTPGPGDTPAAGARPLQLSFEALATPPILHLPPLLGKAWRWPRISTPQLQALARAHPELGPSEIAHRWHVTHRRAYLAKHGVDPYGGRNLIATAHPTTPPD